MNDLQKDLEGTMRVRFDVNNMFATKVGSKHGITEARIEEFIENRDVYPTLAKIRQSGELGFFHLPYSQNEVVDEISTYVAEKKEQIENLVVLGIGGSALGMIALQRALNSTYYNEFSACRKNQPKLYVLDNVDPELIGDFLEHINPKKSLFNVISKSGGTAETMAQFMIVKDKLQNELGKEMTENLVFTTSSQTGNLIKIAEKTGIKTFYIPDNVGGRFSVLSPVGLLPAAFVGINISELLAGAQYMDQICQQENVWQNPAYLNALLQYLAYQDGKNISVMIPYSSALKEMSDWYAQLWAESLGKRVNRHHQVINLGPTPVKALGATDQHSQLQLYMEGPYDKVITFIEVENFRTSVMIPKDYPEISGLTYLGGHTLNELITVEKLASELALTKNQRLNCTLKIPKINPFTIGQLIQFFELTTAFAGELWNIDAFNQPGVELSKNYTYGILGRQGYEEMQTEFSQRQPKDNNLII